MIKAIIFDCFGVLIADALGTMVAQLRDVQPDRAKEIVATVTSAGKGLITRQESSEKVASLLGISMNEYIDRIDDGEVKNQELLDSIAGLRKQYKTGLLSNVSIGGLEARFEPDELKRYFDAVVASGEIGYAKPEPQAYEITADRLGVRYDECIFVDDRDDYCQGATGIGMRSIQYRSNQDLFRRLEQEHGVLLPV